MYNLEKLTTQVTQDKEKQNNNTKQYVLDTAMRKRKTCLILCGSYNCMFEYKQIQLSIEDFVS
jgi:hypothetical protein